MTALEYIQTELENCSRYEPTDDDKNLLETIGIESYVFKKLTSKKFRKWAIDESSEKQIKHALELSISSSKPLQIRYPFGGYKLWRIPSSPEVDWAEFFSIAYYCKYLAPIADAYSPGINFIFTSDDVIIERMDNISPSDTDAYFNSFKNLLELFREYLPKNFTINIVRIGDLYEDKLEMEKELAINIERVTTEYADNIDLQSKQKKYITSELNINWAGMKNLTQLSDHEKRQIIEMGPIYHDAYCALTKRREINRGEDKILVFTTRVPNAIAVGTTKSTITKFWTGYGALQRKSDGYEAKILSPNQLNNQKINKEPIVVQGLRGKNFTMIPLIS